MITLAMLEVSGQFVPLVTPFTDDGSTIGEVRLARLLRYYVRAQVDGLVVASDLGEFTTLTFAERKQLVEWVHQVSHAELNMIVNVSTLSTSSSLDLAQHASRHGSRAVILMPAYYGEFTQEEHVAHIRMVAKHSDRPVIVVDALQVLETDSCSELAQISEVHLASPMVGREFASTDWFRCKELHVEPMSAIPGSCAEDFKDRNRAAVSKTLMLDLDIEVGPPRMPSQPIPYREIRQAA